MALKWQNGKSGKATRSDVRTTSKRDLVAGPVPSLFQLSTWEACRDLDPPHLSPGLQVWTFCSGVPVHCPAVWNLSVLVLTGVSAVGRVLWSRGV